jgi:hypothetical protein
MASLRQALTNDFRVGRTGLRDPLILDPLLYPIIQQLDGIRLEDVRRGHLDVLWNVIEHLTLNDGRAKLVVNTQALADLLTTLVVPVDRMYTAAFLFRFAPEFDDAQDEKELFYTAFWRSDGLPKGWILQGICRTQMIGTRHGQRSSITRSSALSNTLVLS